MAMPWMTQRSTSWCELADVWGWFIARGPIGILDMPNIPGEGFTRAVFGWR
jgi:hypothetical protein